jgi:hypothetical protein
MSKNTDLSELINYVKGASSGKLTFPFYTSTTSFTGTVAGYLAFDSSGNILTTTSPATQWTTSGANIYYNTGNVGINNSSPAYKLDVVGDINITGAFRINGTSIGTGGGGGVSGSGTTNYLTKWSGATSLTNSIASDDGSSFMIGGTSSLYKLTVQPASNINFGIGKQTLNSTDDSIFMNAVNNSYTSVPMLINAAHMGFYIGYSEAMRITSSKIILINTTSGVSGGGILQVNGDVNISGTFKVNGVAIGTGGGSGNISGSGSYSQVPIFTASQTIGNSAFFASPLGDSGSYGGINVSWGGANIGQIQFLGDSASGSVRISSSSNYYGGIGNLKLEALKVIFTNGIRASSLPTSTSGLTDGDFYRDGGGYVRIYYTP